MPGIGSIYYLSYALDNGVDEPAVRVLFAIMIGAVLSSIIIDGLLVHPFIYRLEDEEDAED